MMAWAVVEPFVHRLGWTLLQFLWQGTLIAVLFAATRVLIGRRLSSRSHYAMACGTLALMTAAPILTYVFSGHSSARSIAWLVPVDSMWTQALPWLVAVWVAGVCLCSTRLAGGWMVTRRLRHVGTRPPSSEWQQVFDDLVRRLRLSRSVSLVVSTLVDVPTVVGWLKPVVLMPLQAMTGLPPQYIRTLLAHELAHVRRHDYIVNVLQRVVETVLFYHPAVWWVSEQIRVEREMCCDDIAVDVEGDVLIYARALAELESVRQPNAAVLAATGPSLLHRIRRLLGHTLSTWQLLPGPAAFVAIAVVCGIGVAGLGARDRDGAPVSLPSPSAVAASDAGPSLLAAALLGPVGPAPVPEAPAVPAQSPRPGLPMPAAGAVDSKVPGSIRGRVIDAATGAPIANAALQLLPEVRAANDQPWGAGTTTDSNGRYELRDLSPRRYWLQITRRGYGTETFGNRGNAGGRRIIEMTAGKQVSLPDVALSVGAVINGQVVDQAGDPLNGIVVQALTPAQWDSSRPGAEVSSDVTDDRGAFRIYGLAAGTYFLRAVAGPSGTPLTRFVMATQSPSALVFYPGTFLPSQAQGIVLAKSSETTVSLTFVRGVRPGVSGSVTGVDGAPVASGTVSLRPYFHGNWQRAVESPIIGGSFTVAALSPGEYRLTARNTAGTEMVSQRVTLDGRTERLALVLQRAATMRGRIVLETTQLRHAVRPPDIQIAWFPEGDPPRTSGVTVRQDWTFDITGLVGPQDFGHVPPEGWALKEIRYGSRPQTKDAIELQGEDIEDVQVIFTDRITKISGRVTDGRNQVVPGMVVVFAEERETWRPGTRHADTAEIDTEGAYSITRLPPGRYLAIAVENPEALTPTFLERLRRRATSVTLAVGEHAVLNLTRSTP